MSRFCFIKPFLLAHDLKSSIRSNGKAFVLSFVSAFLGAALGVIVACKIGKQTAPYSVFARLLKLSFAPFSYVLTELFRFLFYLLIGSFGFFLPISGLYPAIALFFYGKHIAQILAFSFLTDSVLPSVLSLLIVYLPLFIPGIFILFFLYLKVEDRKSCCSLAIRANAWMHLGCYLLKLLLIYLIFLIFLFVIVCGTIYLIAIAL